ncbi:MAG: tetratricopeptide repeat protein, partial [Candidatus Hodarchaeota archaeon]
HQKGLAIAEEQGNKQEIGRILNNIGIAYDNKGDLETASDYYRKSLRILEELGNDINTCLPLYALINIATHSGAVETATPFLQQLKVMSEKEESRFISQLYRLAKAKVLKTSERVIKKAEAQELLQQIVNEEIIKHELIVMAMFDLCELLLDEFKAYGGDEVFQEAKTLAESLQTLAQRQNSFSLVVETLILQAKMAIIEGDFIKASETLEKAKITAIEKNLALLSKKASAEKRYMEDQYETWKDLIESNAPFGERLEQARIEGYFASAMKVVKVLRMSEG